MAYSKYGLSVIDDGDIEAALVMPSIVRSEAEEALLSGECHKLNYWDMVSAPQFARSSWLTLSEFKNALSMMNIDESALSLECLLTMEMMASIEARGHYCRMVFWFDV